MTVSVEIMAAATNKSIHGNHCKLNEQGQLNVAVQVYFKKYIFIHSIVHAIYIKVSKVYLI